MNIIESLRRAQNYIYIVVRHNVRIVRLTTETIVAAAAENTAGAPGVF